VEDDGQRRRRSLGGHRGEAAAGGRDDIDLERDQLGRESGEPVGLPLGISVFDQEVAALDVTEVTQALEEGLSGTGIAGRPAVERQPAYASDLVRLLRDGERRRHKSAQRGQQEAAAVVGGSPGGCRGRATARCPSISGSQRRRARGTR
jgi:hypothetical protein